MRTPAVYGREHLPLVTAAEATALDRRARDDAGIPGRALMESAGRAAAEVLHRLHPTGRVLAVVGGGNNGGDAVVALRSLAAWGRSVAWIAASDTPPDAGLLAGADLPRIDDDDVDAAFADAAVLVDGILGTGASGPPRERAAGLIRRMNESERPIVALDIPSGVDPGTGEVPGEAVTAATTVMFGWPKKGGLFQPGRGRCGRIVVVEIGFPPDSADAAGAALITPDWARARLPRRDPDAHKNAVGRVLVIAGRTGMAGAAAIAGRSAVRSGAGLVRLASDEANRGVIQALVPEGLFVDRSDDGALADALEASDAVLIGPALGTGAADAALLDRILERLGDRRCVLDADALTILAGRDDALAALDDRFVLTPHPGEMSRLTGLTVGDIRRDPTGHAAALGERMAGAALLLKGAPSVVARAGEPVLVNTVGSSDLAAAAMGDQLGGMTAAFLAAGARAREAAALGLFFGGRAAELARPGRHRRAPRRRLRPARPRPAPARAPVHPLRPAAAMVSRLGAGPEFDLIRRFLAARPERADADLPGVRVGPGDDCAVVVGDGIAVTVDMAVEDVHFRRAWLTPAEIGRRAAAAALSDLAAMAARPIGVLASVALAREDAAPGSAGSSAAGDGGVAESAGEAVMRGIAAAAAEAGAALIGGDLVRSSGPLVVDIVALGEASAPVLRSGARPGEELWVTGRLGGAAAAVEAWLAGREPDPAARQAFARPVPRIAEARWLAERGVPRAMLDLSDGIAGDAGHVAAASGVRVVVEADALPIADGARVAADPVRLAAAGGEDYELCFTAAGGAGGAVRAEFEAAFGIPLTRVGRIEEGEGVVVVDGRGEPMRLEGFQHWRGDA